MTDDDAGRWQAQTIDRLISLGYGGFTFGPGTKWWPIDKTGKRLPGPFISTDEWLDTGT